MELVLAAVSLAALLAGAVGARWAYLVLFASHDRRQCVGPKFDPNSSLADRKAMDKMASHIDNEVYDKAADSWWDPRQPLSAGLHAMTRLRAPFFADCIMAHHSWNSTGGGDSALRIVDAGCGGGILAEALVREMLERTAGTDCAIELTGVDLAQGAVDAANKHFQRSELAQDKRASSVNYVVGDVRALSSVVAPNSIHVVVIADVLEHINDLPRVLSEISRVLVPGGLMLFDTVNRTLASLFVAIILAQEMPFLSFLPSHTHEWPLFVTPDELRDLATAAGLDLAEMRGFRPAATLKFVRGVIFPQQFHKADFVLTNDTSIQYIGYAVKR